MHDEDGTITVRSFRACFRIERRIHKIDHWRIPVPFGIPLRGIGYAGCVLLAVLVLSRFPVIGVLLAQLHPALRFVALPVGAGIALTRWEIDGRPAHATARAWLRMYASPRRIASWRRAPEPGRVVLGSVTVAPDERGARLRPGNIEGPATLLVRYPFSSREGRSTLHLKPQEGPPRWRGKEIRLAAGQRVMIE
jgi:hypothetical protein